MTRKEEIELAWFNKEVQSNHRYDEKTFKEAVEWADKTMIDKACEWLEQHTEDYDMYDEWSGDYVSFKSLIIDFRKAMEN